MYRLDKITGEITEIASDEARRVLTDYGWSARLVDELFVSAKVLTTSFFAFCRFRGRLEEIKQK